MFIFKNSFYYIPKNTFTFEVGYNQLNKYFINNPLKYIGFDYTLEVNGKYVNVYWNKDNSNIVNIDYKLTHYHNNKLQSMLHIQDNEKSVKEFFYVKPHTIHEDIAKIIYGLEYNGTMMYKFDFDTIYDSPYRTHKNALFDKYKLYDKFSQKYLDSGKLF
jgi:hypothetical protein